MSIAKKIRLSDFQSRFLQTVCDLQWLDSTLTVQVAGLRDYDQSFASTPESQEIGFYFVAMDTLILYIIMGM